MLLDSVETAFIFNTLELLRAPLTSCVLVTVISQFTVPTLCGVHVLQKQLAGSQTLTSSLIWKCSWTLHTVMSFRTRHVSSEKNGEGHIAEPGRAKKKPPAHVDPTAFFFLQQEVVFANWWARMTPTTTVGIAQRFLLSFCGDVDPALMSLANFMDVVTLPLLKELFALFVRRIGPVLAGASVPHMSCSPEHNDTIGELENICEHASSPTYGS